MNHSIVIATRNLPAALRILLPWMLKQARLPAPLIVVESSGDLIRRLSRRAGANALK